MIYSKNKKKQNTTHNYLLYGLLNNKITLILYNIQKNIPFQILFLLYGTLLSLLFSIPVCIKSNYFEVTVIQMMYHYTDGFLWKWILNLPNISMDYLTLREYNNMKYCDYSIFHSYPTFEKLRKNQIIHCCSHHSFIAKHHFNIFFLMNTNMFLC